MKTNQETATKAARLDAASAQAKLKVAEGKGAKAKAAVRAAKVAYKQAKKTLKLARKKAKAARKAVGDCREAAADAARELDMMEKKAAVRRGAVARAARPRKTKTKSVAPFPAIVSALSPAEAHAGPTE